jgi:hypothetical protein
MPNESLVGTAKGPGSAPLVGGESLTSSLGDMSFSTTMMMMNNAAASAAADSSVVPQ